MRETLLDDYGRALPLLRAHGDELQAQLAALLAADEELKVHSVTLRLKSHASLAQKLARPDRSYDSLWSVTDLVGLRVIVYFEDAVDAIGKLLETHLPIDFAHSIDKRRRDARTFGYRWFTTYAACGPPQPTTGAPAYRPKRASRCRYVPCSSTRGPRSSTTSDTRPAPQCPRRYSAACIASPGFALRESGKRVPGPRTLQQRRARGGTHGSIREGLHRYLCVCRGAQAHRPRRGQRGPMGAVSI